MSLLAAMTSAPALIQARLESANMTMAWQFPRAAASFHLINA
jgi:hypothetical protein